jgi:hypothetical protein
MCNLLRLVKLRSAQRKLRPFSEALAQLMLRAASDGVKHAILYRPHARGL